MSPIEKPASGAGQYKVLTGIEAGELRDETHEFALAVLQGLSERPKRLSSRYFYDARGSELFARIMDVPQYYPTDCEREILDTHFEAITEAVRHEPFDLVDLGAGDGRKTRLLLEPLLRMGVNVRYVPIDISEQAVSALVDTLATELPELEVQGLVSEYTDGLRWLHAQPDSRRKLVLFLGSNIGNFGKPAARGVLRRLWSALVDGDRVLIGFDLKKDIDLLLAAYNDPQGITSQFNLNLLGRINRELGGDFDVSRFRHYGTYSVFSGAMESYLVSLDEQEVFIASLNNSFHFEPWEPIHTEYSYKYLPSDIDALANATGFVIEGTFQDRRKWFTDSLWRVTK